jgi:hypothetical protein
VRALGLAGCAFAACAIAPRVASAEPPWVDRHIVLPEHDWSFDLGLGIQHDRFAPDDQPTGTGLNFEMAVSPVNRLELGIRSGLRIGDDGRATQADEVGRLFDRQTFGTNNDVFANPEIRVRGALLEHPIVEIGLEGRVFLPAEQYSAFGFMVGLPFLFHIAGVARIDTGFFVPVVLYDPVQVYLSVPLDVWFQVTNRLWLGPETGIVFDATHDHAIAQLGFGLGYQILRNLDLKTQFLFPQISEPQGAQTFGFGVGIEVRIE